MAGKAPKAEDKAMKPDPLEAQHDFHIGSQCVVSRSEKVSKEAFAKRCLEAAIEVGILK